MRKNLYFAKHLFWPRHLYSGSQYAWNDQYSLSVVVISWLTITCKPNVKSCIVFDSIWEIFYHLHRPIWEITIGYDMFMIIRYKNINRVINPCVLRLKRSCNKEGGAMGKRTWIYNNIIHLKISASLKYYFIVLFSKLYGEGIL